MYRLEIVAEAKTEITEELSYSAKNWGKKHSREYAKSLREKIRVLKKSPFICPLRNDIVEGVRLLKHKGNLIIYTLVEDENLVLILALISIHKEINSRHLKQRIAAHNGR